MDSAQCPTCYTRFPSTELTVCAHCMAVVCDACADTWKTDVDNNIICPMCEETEFVECTNCPLLEFKSEAVVCVLCGMFKICSQCKEDSKVCTKCSREISENLNKLVDVGIEVHPSDVHT